MNKKQTKGCAIVPASSNAKLQGRENILMARSWGADTVYELADAFRQRCLIESNSLLWPNEPVWTTDNITELERVAFNRDDPSIPQELVYWDDVSRTLTLPLRKLGADIALMYQLFPSKSAQTKFGDVRYMFDGNDPPLVPHADVWTLFEQAAGHGLGDAGRWYLSGGQQWSALFYLRFAKEVKTSSVDVYDRPTMQALADRVEESIRYNTVTARNMILHLFFPDYFEPISNQGHKEDIRAAFCSRLGIPATDDIDHDLWVIRDRMVADGRTDHFNFYDGDLRPLWNNWRKNPSVPEPTGDDDTIHREPLTALQENDLRTLMEPTHLNESVLQEINELLLTKRQLIFEGPPGSGKTFVAEKFARWFTGQPLDATSPLNEQVEIVQFHQSYGYEDFVQGIRPETNDQDQLVYRVKDGIFLQLCLRAQANPEKPFVLIIDEINRGNLSRIFGELLLLLEYRGMTARLPYGSGDGAQISIPENLYIIGTMNTADRSLAQIDYALRRRFYFIRFMPVENGRAEVFENWLATQEMSDDDRTRLAGIFINLNHGIREHLNTDDLQVGHSYFMQKDIATEAGFRRVWSRAVAPLLNEYLHHHRDRENILSALTPRNLMPQDPASAIPEDDNAEALDPELV